MRILPVVVAALVTGCASAPRYAYRLDVDPAPPLRGEVRVATVGVTGDALHVRLSVHNRDDGAWVVLPEEQRARFGRSRDPLRLVRAECDGAAVADAVVEPDDTRTIDLYYAVPDGGVDERAVVVEWRVATTKALLPRGSSRFTRYALPEPAAPPVDLHAVARDLSHDDGDWRDWRYQR